MSTTTDIVKQALAQKCAIPAFNIPFLPMMEPIMKAIKDEETVAMIAVARVEWEKFGSKGIEPIYKEYIRLANDAGTWLHLDHVPVVDEDHVEVDYYPIISQAIELGYQSVMVDGSRLPFEQNVEAVQKVTELAGKNDIPVEAELGKVLGHESGPGLTYEEILRTRAGYTEPEEAKQFVAKTGCDWLSVACGNIHGAISELMKDEKKPAGQLDIEHLKELYDAAKVPLVLHGGSGVETEMLHRAIEAGIAKVNVGTELRQAYQRALERTGSVEKAQQAVYDCTKELLKNHFQISGLKHKLFKH